MSEFFDNLRFIRSDDPVSNFLVSLFVRFNFEDAANYLCKSIQFVRSDENLVKYLEKYTEAARFLFLERLFDLSYNVSIRHTAQLLQLPFKTTKDLIVQLINVGKLKGKIDSCGNNVDIYEI
ncbi:hypothetical protein ACOME3_000121 [Neoechinorhynchus agilis]